MDGFLIALLLVFALALGGREQWLMAQWASARGPRVSLLAAGVACSAGSATAMAWAGSELAALLPGRAAQMLVALALGFAAVELAWPVRQSLPREPTRSLGAFAIVLLVRQLGDGARFAVFALAAWAHLPLAAGLGGALGGAGAVAMGWALGTSGLARLPLRTVRMALGAALLVAALFIGLNARFAVI